MKINNIGPSGVNPYKNNLNKQEEIKKSGNHKKDQIEISSTAKELQHTSQLVAQRQEKVEQIKISVENGTYSINPQEIAKSIVDFYKKK